MLTIGLNSVAVWERTGRLLHPTFATHDAEWLEKGALGMKKKGFAWRPGTKLSTAFMLPMLVAAIYGSATVQVTWALGEFIGRIGPANALQFVGFALSIFGAVALWPALIQFGRGVPYQELQRRLKESEASVKSLEGTRVKLEDKVEGYAAELETAYRRFRLVLKTFNIATFYCDREHKVEWAHNVDVNDELLVGKSDAEFLPPDAAQTMTRLKRDAIEDGQMHEGQITVPEAGGDKHYIIQVAPRLDRYGKCIGTICISSDVTERALWHQHLVLMINEVNHRARNVLATLLSILSQTAQTATSVTDLHKKIFGRTMALSEGIALISDDSWTASSMRNLFDRQLKKLPHGHQARFTLYGSDICLVPKAIQNLSLVLHELTENAQAFGALSVEDGRVKLSWTEVDEQNFSGLVIEWQELNATDVQEPAHRGLGLRMLEDILLTELNGSGSATWRSEGLHFVMRIPDQWLNPAGAHATKPTDKSNPSTVFAYESLNKKRIAYDAA